MSLESISPTQKEQTPKEMFYVEHINKYFPLLAAGYNGLEIAQELGCSHAMVLDYMPQALEIYHDELHKTVDVPVSRFNHLDYVPLPPEKNVLTPRQKDVASLIAYFEFNDVQLSAQLGIGLPTVRKFKRHLFEKLDVTSAEQITPELLENPDMPRLISAPLYPAFFLSHGQRDVFICIGQGYDDLQIEEVCGIEHSVLKDRIKKMNAKLNIKNRSQAKDLYQFYISNGIL